MKKKLTIQFHYSDGKKEVIDFETDRGYDWTVEQFSRNRNVVGHELIEESSSNNKQMLFG